MTQTIGVRVRQFAQAHRGARFTLEAGRGQTYVSGKPTLYGHSYYKKGSVLAGRPLRQFIEQWDDWSIARGELDAAGVEYQDMGDSSTHVSVEELTAHLPDDTDY